MTESQNKEQEKKKLEFQATSLKYHWLSRCISQGSLVKHWLLIGGLGFDSGGGGTAYDSKTQQYFYTVSPKNSFSGGKGGQRVKLSWKANK